THMTHTEGYVWRVDRGNAEHLYRRGNFPEPLPADRPHLPISHIIEDPRTGAIRVFSFSDIYRTDARLARWEKTHTLKIRYRWGRPDAVGSYPSVESVIS